MRTLAAVLPLLLGIGGGVSAGGVSGGGVRSSSELSIRLIGRGKARGNEDAFEGCTLAFGDCITTLGGSSIAESLSLSAGSKEIFVGLVFSSW